jgi:hypothetical protein
MPLETSIVHRRELFLSSPLERKNVTNSLKYTSLNYKLKWVLSQT